MSKPAEAQLVPQKNTISTEQIKEIVKMFNSEPLNKNLTLVALDELNTFELGDLLSDIFKYMDPERTINSKETQKEQIIYKVSEFLKVLLYQSSFDQAWQNGLISGDRKVIYPIFYYLLANLEQHKKRAYLAKYLVPLDIPEMYAGDPEIKKLNEQYRQLQAEFQVTHESFEAVNKASLNPAELKKQIQQLEQEKDQLQTKIGTMKSKHANKPQFSALFEATNLLRRQQQEEARLVDKIQSQRQQLENAEAQLMSLQQSLADAKKSLAPTNTPQQMLQATKNEVKKNRELVKERMTFEYNQRLRKLQNTERMLSEPPITQNELMILESQMMNTRRLVSQMEERLSKDNTHSDKLAIFKSQAAVVTKKKEQAMEALKRDEEELESLGNEIRKKEDQIHKQKGTGMAKNQLESYLNEIKEKKVKYTRIKAELEEIRWEISNLKRTEQILREEKAKYEKAYGLAEGAVKPQANLANASMEEINKQTEKLLDQIKKKKNQLAPKLQEKKSLQPKFENTQREYKAAKQNFDNTINKIEDEMKQLETRVGKLKDEVYGMDTKINLARFKSQIVESKIARLNEEAENVHGRGKGINSFKSYAEFFNSKIKEREKEISELAVHRQKVSDNHLPSLQQLTMFTDLKKLLKTKMDAQKGDNIVSKKGEKHGNNVNVLQIG